MNIVKAVEALAKYFRECLTNDKYYLQYKSTTDPEEFEANVPSVYCFTCPSSAIIDNYPAKCPCIVLTLDGRDDTTYDITAHLCISSVSQSEQEMAHPVKDNPNLYDVGEGEGYSTESDDDLIIESILFTDQIANYIYGLKTLDVSEINVEYPSVDLPDFPYAISSVSFKLGVDNSHTNNNPYNEYY